MIEETIFGMYSFENDTRVDVVKREVGGDVVRHERTHGYISTFSSIGLLLIMMHKAYIVTPDKYWLYEELCRSIREVQEITATIVKYYSIWENRGKEDFVSKAIAAGALRRFGELRLRIPCCERLITGYNCYY